MAGTLTTWAQKLMSWLAGHPKQDPALEQWRQEAEDRAYWRRYWGPEAVRERKKRDAELRKFFAEVDRERDQDSTEDKPEQHIKKPRKRPAPRRKPRKIETKEEKATRLIGELEVQGKPLTANFLAEQLKLSPRGASFLLKNMGYEKSGRAFLDDGSQPHIYKKKISDVNSQAANKQQNASPSGKTEDLSGKESQNEVVESG